MSHNIRYEILEENVNKQKVMAHIQEIAKSDGDGYCSNMTWHTNVPPFETVDEADEFIKKKDNGWYDDHAVRFKDYSKATKTKKMEEYEAKSKELLQGKKEYISEHLIKNFKAQFVGCPKCGSKLSKEYLRGNNCPLCGVDMRSKTVLDKINWYDDKIKQYNDKIKAEKKKQSDKAVIKWLVKYEYHS
jgi:hypothetical protein